MAAHGERDSSPPDRVGANPGHADPGGATPDNATLPVTITTGAWFLAGLALLALGSRLPEGQRWWIATCAVGVISGLGGIGYLRHRAYRIRRATARQAAPRSAD